MNKHVHLNTAAPRVYDALMALNDESAAYAKSVGLPTEIAELIRVRASQINGCAFCLRMHTRIAREAGESNDRLSVLSTWRDTEYFTPQERASLSLTEKTTLVSQSASEVYDDTRERTILTDEQVAAVQWLIIAINAFNRVSITSAFDVRP